MLTTEQQEQLRKFTSSYAAFLPDEFLDWVLWEAKIQFKIETIGWNGGWSLKRVDPGAIMVENRIELIDSNFKDLIWKAAQALRRIESKEKS